MSTGYFYADWRQGGSVPGRMSSVAGGMLTVLDWLMLQGPSPWTKTVLGTNIASYTAPGGSQIALYVDNSSGPTTGINARVRGTVAGQTFPTPAQESVAGSIMVQTATQNSVGTTFWYGWYGVRTDRMMLLWGQNAIATSGSGFFLLAGDMPVYDPADPGLCVVMGSTRAVAFPNTNSFVGSSLFQNAAVFQSTLGCGAAYQSKVGGTFSIPAELRTPLALTTYPSVTGFNSIPLMPMIISTNSVHRGWMPFFYPSSVSGMVNNAGAITQGDTFNAGSAVFESIRTADTHHFLWMTNDAEPLP